MYHIARIAAVFLTLLLASEATLGQSGSALVPLDSTGWSVGVAPRSELPQTGAFEYEFSKIEVSQINSWLAWVGLAIPVPLDGQLSGWLWAQRSERSWLNFADYRVEAQIFSPLLRVDTWQFSEAELRFGFADGTWYVGRLSGEVSMQTNPEIIGQANFIGKLPTKKPQLLELSGDVTGIKLQPLFAAFRADFIVSNDSGVGRVAARVPLASVDTPEAWKASLALDVQGVESVDIPHSNITASIAVADGKWQFANGQIIVLDQPLRLDGRGQLQPPLTFTVDVFGDELSAAQLLSIAKISQLMPPVTGNVDVVGKIRGNLEAGIDAASAAVRSTSIRVDTKTNLSFLIETVLDNRLPGHGVWRLDIQSAEVAEGRLHGSLTWKIPGMLPDLFPTQANLQIENIDLAHLPPCLAPLELGGLASGQISVESKRDDQGRLNWSTDSRLDVSDLALMVTRIGDAQIMLTKAAAADHLSVVINEADETLDVKLIVELEGEADSGSVAPLKSYTATGSVREFQTRVSLNEGGHEIPIRASGTFRLQGSPKNWLATGQAELTQLQADSRMQTIELSDLLLTIQEQAWRLERFRVRDEQGRAAGSAIIRRDGNGEHQLNVRVVDAELEPYASEFAPFTFRSLGGTVNLESRLHKRANATDWLEGWQGNFQAEVTNCNYRNTLLGTVSLVGEANGDILKASARGTVLGGKLVLDGTFANNDLREFVSSRPVIPATLSASLAGAELDRLMTLVFGPLMGQRYSGRASLELLTDDSNSVEQACHLHVTIPNFRYQQLQLAQTLSADLSYREGRLTVRKLTGGFANGRIDVRGDFVINQESSSGELRFMVDQIQLNSLVAMIAPASAADFSGMIDYRGQMQLGKQIVLLGNSRLSDVSVYRLPLQDVRTDLRISLSTVGDLIELQARNLRGTALGGNLVGSASVRGGARYAVETDIRVNHGKLDQLSRALGFEHIVGTGSFTAAGRLQTKDATDLSALTGPVQLDFENGDVQSIPVLSEIGRLIPAIQLTSTGIKRGTVHGQIARGQFRFDDLFLDSDAFWLLADGRASLSTGQLDIDALLQTGGSLEDQITQNATQKLLATALPQALLLTQLNDLLRNRSVFFHVGGSTARPVIQPKTAPTAAKALLQNVQRQLLIAPALITSDGVDSN